MDPIEVYHRCLQNRPYSNQLRIYTKKYLQKVVLELAQLEEFEKCIELNKFIEKRFDFSQVSLD